jgi:hypothetical protein
VSDGREREREGVHLGRSCATPGCRRDARHWIEWLSTLNDQVMLDAFCTRCRNVILANDGATH